MRILYVITGLHKGGAEGQLLELCDRIRRRGHEVEVVSALPLSGYADDIKALGIPVHSLEVKLGQLDVKALPRLARIIWRMRPDVVHSLMVHSNLLTRVTRLVAPTPALVNTALGISESRSPDESARPRELAYAATDWLSDVTTQVSEVCAEHYVDIHAVSRRRMRVVPCGVDATRFVPFDPSGRAAARAEFSISGDDFKWLCVARFTKDKDHHTLLEAFALVLKRAPTAKLILKGIGALEAEIRAQISRLGLGASVRIITERVAMERLLNTVDGFVLSSVREGMPTVLLEAAACGLPLVATDVGGNPEVALDGKNGFTVPARDPARLADAMVQVMALAAHERAAMAQHGRELVEDLYDFERVTTKYEQLYESLKGQRNNLWGVGPRLLSRFVP